jgi:hypothetical protein
MDNHTKSTTILQQIGRSSQNINHSLYLQNTSTATKVTNEFRNACTSPKQPSPISREYRTRNKISLKIFKASRTIVKLTEKPAHESLTSPSSAAAQLGDSRNKDGQHLAIQQA